MAALLFDFEKKSYAKDAEIGYETTRFAQPIVKNLRMMVDFQKSKWVAFTVAQYQQAHGDSLLMAQEIAQDWRIKAEEKAAVVPRGTVALTVLATGEFDFGTGCQDFVVRKGMAPGSYWTYRKITKRVHATFYNVNGRECLAGLCYFLQLKDSRCINTAPDKLAIQTPLWKIRSISRDGRGPLKNGRYSRFCKTSNDQVDLFVDGKQVRHMVCDFVQYMKSDKICKECNDDYAQYLNEIKMSKEKAAAAEKVVPPRSVEMDVFEKAFAEKQAHCDEQKTVHNAAEWKVISLKNEEASKVFAEQVAFKKAQFEKAAAKKAELEKAAAEKAALEKAELEKAKLEKLELEKADAEKLAAQRAVTLAATQKFALEQASLAHVLAQKAAYDKADMEKAAAEKANPELIPEENSKIAAAKANAAVKASIFREAFLQKGSEEDVYLEVLMRKLHTRIEQHEIAKAEESEYDFAEDEPAEAAKEESDIEDDFDIIEKA